MDYKKFLEYFSNTALFAISSARKGMLTLGPANEDTFQKAEDLNSGNSPRKKYDIYFTPNGGYGIYLQEEIKNSGVRTQSNAKIINAFIADIDLPLTPDIDKEKEKVYDEIISSFITPSFVVETRKGFHVYYLLDEPIPYKGNEKFFEDVEKLIIDYLDADSQCKDVSRVLRVPGFKYWKDGKGEFKVNLLLDNHEIKYDKKFFKNMLKTHINFDIENDDIYKRTQVSLTNEESQKDWDERWDEVNNLDVKEVLEDLYPAEVLPNGAIKREGKNTDGYKWNKKANYVNNFSPHDDRPKGGPYHIIKKKFDGDFKKIYEYIEDRRGIKVKNKEKYMIAPSGVMLEEEYYKILNELEKIHDTVFNRPQDIKKLGIIEFNYGGLIFSYNFEKIKLVVYQIGPKGKRYRLNDYLNGIILLPLGVAAERKNLVVLGLKYKIDGTVGIDVLVLKEYDRSLSAARVLSKLGYQLPNENKIFGVFLSMVQMFLVYDFTIIDTPGIHHIDGKFYMVLHSDTGKYEILPNKKGLVYDIAETYKVLEKVNLNKIETVDSKDDIIDIVKVLNEFYPGIVTYPIFLNLVLSYWIDYFRINKIQVPITFILGMKGTGKTTILTKMFDLFGLYVQSGNSMTSFSLMFLLGYKGPVWFNEYRYGDKGAMQLEGKLRSSFDGMPDFRGTRSQTLIGYEANGKIFIDGQSSYTDSALMERTFYIRTTPKLLKQGNKRAIKKIENRNILKYILNKKMPKNILDTIEDYVDGMDDYVGKTINSERVKYVYSHMLFAQKILGIDNVDEFNGRLKDAMILDLSMKNNDEIKDIFKTLILNIMKGYTKNQMIEIHDDYIGFEVNSRLLDVEKKGLLDEYSLGVADKPSKDTVYLPFEEIIKDTVLLIRFMKMISLPNNNERFMIINMFKDRKKVEGWVKALLLAYKEKRGGEIDIEVDFFISNMLYEGKVKVVGEIYEKSEEIKQIIFRGEQIQDVDFN